MSGPDARRLSILHLGTGFRPLRRGGLVAYAEDLMAEQVRAGHAVAYLFAGREYPVPGGPRLRRWSRGGVAMLEIVNSPLSDHGRQPELELAEPRIEGMLARVLAEHRPDVVHVQELAGLPSSVLDVARAAGAPVVMTLQDYFPLCPAFRLMRADGRACPAEAGADCRATTSEPHNPDHLLGASLQHDLRRLGRAAPLAAGAIARAAGRPPRAFDPAAAAPAATFARRRAVNVARLNQTDRLIAMSARVAELYAELGVDRDRLTTMRLTLAHIERLTPRPPARVPGEPVTFATLGGGESVAKGSRLLLDAVRALAPRPFRLLVLGHAERAFAAAARALPGVELRGSYPPHGLDALLDEVDVGLMPSIWEEAYGYAGVEFLAKGIPVIANAKGGMVEYVRPGETGWLNASADAAGLAAIMRRILDRPDEARNLGARVRARRAEIVLPMARHAAAMEAVYRELAAA